MARPNTSVGIIGGLVHDKLNDNTVEELYGRTSLSEHSGQRRIHWVSPGGTLEAPKQAGGRRDDETAAQRKPTCKTISAELEIHIFAEDDEAIETLFRNVLAALALTNVRYDRGRYRSPTQEDVAASGITNRVEWLILSIVVGFPAIEEIQALRTVVSTDQTSGIDHADGTFVPQ